MDTFSALLAPCEGNPPVTGGFPSQRPVTRSFDIFFELRWTNGWANNGDAGDLRRHILRSLWRHCNVASFLWPSWSSLDSMGFTVAPLGGFSTFQRKKHTFRDRNCGIASELTWIIWITNPWTLRTDYVTTTKCMVTSSNGNMFCVTGPLWAVSGERWIPLTKASDAELW